MKTVLVLCTGNSCRSQMAEGLVNGRIGDQFVACSAGTAPSGYVHPQAIAVMAESGIDISANHSKSVEEYAGVYFDYVITVCDGARETCPVWLEDAGQKVHIGFVDPAETVGADEEVTAVFRQVRDEIADQILGYLGSQEL